MILALIQVTFAAVRTVSRSAVNIMLYSLLSRVFNQWFGFNSIISFFCSAYCLSKIVAYFKRLWLNARLRNKKPDEKLVPSELTWHSGTSAEKGSVDHVQDTIRVQIHCLLFRKPTEQSQSIDQFENDWRYLLDDDAKNLLPSIVNIPFNNGFLFFITLMVIDYQMNSLDFSYAYALVRTLAFLIVLICGSSIRYQTLIGRERQDFFQVMLKQRDEIERYIVYSADRAAPVASICLQNIPSPEIPTLIVRLFQLNSKFDDYIHDVEHFLCQKVIERAKTLVSERGQRSRVVWSVPTCRQNWSVVLKANKFALRETYEDFAFLPLVKSYVEQYEYVYHYEELPPVPTVQEDPAMVD